MQVEEVVELLLTSLSNKDTVVRWAAAKGVGRVTGHARNSWARNRWAREQRFPTTPHRFHGSSPNKTRTRPSKLLKFSFSPNSILLGVLNALKNGRLGAG